MQEPKSKPPREPAPTDPPRATRFVHDDEELVVFSLPLEATSSAAPPASAWRTLTPAELKVVTLAIEGRSNREIAELRGAAPRTIAKQLENAYRRLGINSRRELAVLVARLRGARRPDE